ncbi:unnamed protein product [Closterium sp. Yama58-4]|nr:unnamed protein product [Closterium sp. Yama58-4]
MQLPVHFGRLGAPKTLRMVKQKELKLPEGLGGMANIRSNFHRQEFNQLQLGDSLSQLTSLAQLDLDFISDEELPEVIGKLDQLRQLHMQCCFNLREIPGSITQLNNLETLTIGMCWQLVSLPKKLDSLIKLRRLELIGCHNVMWLNGAPISFPSFLESLTLGSYDHSIFLPDLPVLPCLKKLTLNLVECGRACVSKPNALPRLEHLELVLADDAEELAFPWSSLPHLRILEISRANDIEALPRSICSGQKQLRRLQIDNALELKVLPGTISQLHHLTSLKVHAPKLASLPASIGALARLRELDLSECSALKQLLGFGSAGVQSRPPISGFSTNGSWCCSMRRFMFFSVAFALCLLATLPVKSATPSLRGLEKLTAGLKSNKYYRDFQEKPRQLQMVRMRNEGKNYVTKQSANKMASYTKM